MKDHAGPAGWPRLARWAAIRLLGVLALVGLVVFGLMAGLGVAAGIYLVPAATLLASGILRLSRLLGAVRGDAGVSARLCDAGGLVLATGLAGGQNLEWKVLRGQPRADGRVRVYGPARPSAWLVVRLPDGRLIWPRCRAQPVVGSGTLRLSAAITRDSGPLAEVHRLLATYVELTELVAALPLVVRRPTGPSDHWWRVGAPRPLVQALVLAHCRRHLAALTGGLVRRAMRADPREGGRARASLLEASRECGELARNLPRLGVLASAASLVSWAVGPLSPLLPWTVLKLGLGYDYAVPAIYACLSLALLPLLAFFHAVRCERALLCPPAAIPRWARANEPTWLAADWDVYELEAGAFAAAGMARPRERESRRSILLLACAVYGVAALPLLVLLAIGLTPSSRIDGYVVAATVIFSTAALYLLTRWRRRRAGRRRLRAQSGASDSTRRSPEDQNQIPVGRTGRA